MSQYAMASKLTAALKGYSSPAVHAVPMDAPPSNATALCGVAGLAVIAEHDGPIQFDADSPYSCKRCTKRARTYA